VSAATSVSHIGRVPRPPLIDIEGMGGPPAIAGVDFDQWTPPYLMLGNALQNYCREHLMADGRDPRRMTIVAKHAFRLWGPEVDCTKLDRAKTREYIAARMSEGAKGATIRRELALVQAGINHNVREGRIEKAPKFAKPSPGSPRLRWLTREEYKRLMAQPMEYRIKIFLLLAFGTGARSFAIEELRWSQVNFQTRLIDYKRPGAIYRNKRRAIVPIGDALLPRLETAFARRKDDFVIGAGGCTYRKVKALMRGIGIDEEGVARHVARHTFASWLLQAGVPIAYVAQLLGDKVSMVEAVYGHLVPDNTRGAVNLALLAA
jgi:integrase